MLSTQQFTYENDALNSYTQQLYAQARDKVEEQKNAALQLLGESVLPFYEGLKNVSQQIKAFTDMPAIKNIIDNGEFKLPQIQDIPKLNIQSVIESNPTEIEMQTFVGPSLSKLPKSFNDILEEQQGSVFKFTEPITDFNIQNKILDGLEDLGDRLPTFNIPTITSQQYMLDEFDPEDISGTSALTASARVNPMAMLQETLEDPLRTTANISEQIGDVSTNLQAKASDVINTLTENTASTIEEATSGVSEAVEGISSGLAEAGAAVGSVLEGVVPLSLGLFGLVEAFRNAFSSIPAPQLIQDVPSYNVGF